MPHVELARLGSWAASTGMVHLTPEAFADMVAAAVDPEIDFAPVKIGHVSTRFSADDGEPALGWLANVHVEGSSIFADLDGVPAGFAPRLADAFRRRSVEILWNVKTPSGKSYRAVLTGLALLGVTPPAVKGMADIEALYASPARTAASAVVAESSSVLTMGGAQAGELDAARAAVAQLAASVGAPPAGVAALNELLEGLAGATIPHLPGDRGEHGRRDPTSEGSMPMNEQRIRELLGVQADADLDAEVEKLIAAGGVTAATPPAAGTAPAGAAAGQPSATPSAGAPAPAASAGTPAAGTPTGGPSPAGAAPAAPAPGQAPASPPPAGDLVGAGAAALAAPPPGTVTLSAAQWAEVEKTLGTVTATRRAAVVGDALRSGRIHPSEQAAYLAAVERDEAGTTALLASLAPNKFAVAELGSSSTGNGPGDALAADGADEAAWAAFGAQIGVPGLGNVPQSTPAGTPAAQ